MKASAFAVLLLAALGTACGKTSSSSPSKTPASPGIHENFLGTLPVGGSRFYAFSLAVYGTVNATLVGLSGQDVDPATTVSLGIGTPSGTSCFSNSPTSVSTTGTAVVTATEEPGVYCAVISDPGNLPNPADFAVVIDHP